MRYRIKTEFLFTLFSLLLLYSCAEKVSSTSTKQNEIKYFARIEPEPSLIEFDGYDKNGYLFGAQNMVLANDNEFTVDWSIYKNTSENMVLSLPSDWEVKSKSNSVLFAMPDTLKKDFLIVKKFSKDIYNVKLLDIVQSYLDVIKSDTIEIASNINLQKYTLENKIIGYYFTSEMYKEKLSSRASTLFVEREKFFYELTMKMYEKDDAGALLSLEFETVLDNIFISGDRVFGSASKKNKLKEIEFGG